MSEDMETLSFNPSLEHLLTGFQEADFKKFNRYNLADSENASLASSFTEIDSDIYRLPNKIVIRIISECASQLELLFNVNKPIAGDPPPKNLLVSSLHHGSQFYIPDKFDDRNFELYNIEKFQQDLSSIIYTLNVLVKDMTNTNGFAYLRTMVENIKLKIEKEKELLTTVKRLRKYYQKLKTCVGKEKAIILQKTDELNERIKQLRLMIEDEREYSDAKKNYSRKWQDSRIEQNKMVVENKENAYNFIISESDRKSKLEDDVHKCIKTFLTESKDDFQNEIETWMEKYDCDLDQKELDIANKRVELDRLISKTESMSLLFDQRQDEINSYLLYKRDKKLNEILTRIQTRAVQKIQAWWRAVMIWKGLGPYRKGKGKGAKNKKGAGKKKKK